MTVDRHHASGGHGLAGLAERVGHRGGRLDYGVTDEGFEVRLHAGGGEHPVSVRVVIADDQTVVREGLRSMLMLVS